MESGALGATLRPEQDAAANDFGRSTVNSDGEELPRRATLLDPSSTPSPTPGFDGDWLDSRSPSVNQEPASAKMSRSMSRSFMSDGRSRSAPLLPAAHSTHGSTWYSGTQSLASGSRQTCWRPLGSTWRDWETDGISRVRNCPDDGRAFINGSVPHWGKQANIRMKGVLEHELTWAYYRMRRHFQHPLRKEVGEALPKTGVAESMRGGKGSEFHFWRDLRPPFFVLSVKRVDNPDAGGPSHPDGELHKVTYECGIEFFAEQAMGTKGDVGVLDNRIHGDALVRFSNSFPVKRPMTIVSWGQPVLNWTGDKEEEQEKEIDPGAWMPIADEVGKRSDSAAMANCRSLTREATQKAKAKEKRGVQVPELDRMLLGPHCSLPRLARAQAQLDQATSNLDSTINSNATIKFDTKAKAKPAKTRKHKIFTSACGFVHYAG